MMSKGKNPKRVFATYIITTTSDWTAISLSGAKMFDIHTKTSMGRVKKTPTSIELRKQPYDKCLTELKVRCSLELQKDSVIYTITKGDIGKTEVEIRYDGKMMGKAENIGNFIGNPSNPKKFEVSFISKGTFIKETKEKTSAEEIDIVLLTMNQLGFTRKCIQSLYGKTSYPFRLIIVDNASSDGTVSFLKRLEKRKRNVVLHLNKKRDSGFGEGINTGLQYCKSDFVLLLNNDIEAIEEGWLENMVRIMALDNRVAIVGCKLLYPNGKIQHAGAYFTKSLHWEHIGRHHTKEKYSVERELAGVTGACILVRRAVIMPEGLDERYIIGQWEDVALCCEVRKNGWSIIYTPHTTMTHHESVTFRTKKDCYRQADRNAALFHKEWDSWLRRDMKKTPNLYKSDYCPKRPLVSLIMTTHNELEFTKETIETLFENTIYKPWELIVVDGASTDGTLEYLRSKHIRTIALKKPYYYAYAVNRGWEVAEGEILGVLNNDLIFKQKGWLTTLLRTLKDPSVGFVGPMLLNPRRGRHLPSTGIMFSEGGEKPWKALRLQPNTVRPTCYVIGACFLVKKEIIEEIGMMDEEFKFANDEVDFCIRVWKAGYKVLCNTYSEVYHWIGTTYKKDEKVLEFKRTCYKLLRTKWKPNDFRDVNKRVALANG